MMEILSSDLVYPYCCGDGSQRETCNYSNLTKHCSEPQTLLKISGVSLGIRRVAQTASSIWIENQTAHFFLKPEVCQPD